MGKSYVLGLDIGPTSIGWAVIDLDRPRLIPILDRDGRIETPGCGVRIFQECVDPKKNVSNNEQRRKARGQRRQIYRRAQRKKHLRDTLIQFGLYPANEAAQWELEKSLEDSRHERFKLYRLRAKAAHSSITPFEFGRVLLHLNQRRGFKSNRKGERGKRDGKVLGAIAVLRERLHAAIEANQAMTLGEYLFKVVSGEIVEAVMTDSPAIPVHGATEVPQVRRRYTQRNMHEAEFDAIWDRQASLVTSAPDSDPFEGKLRDNTLRVLLRQLIFYQRPLKSSKHLIGRCPCEPKEARCPRANWHAQQFRILKEVANLVIQNPDGTRRQLTPNERKQIVDELGQSKELKFDRIRTSLLNLHDNQEFNLEQGVGGTIAKKRRDASATGPKRASLKGNLVEHAIIDAFGEGKWHDLSDDAKSTVRAAVVDIEDVDEFTRIAVCDWGVSPDAAAELADIELPEGYMSYSLKAILKLNSQLEQSLNRENAVREYDALELCGYSSSTTWRPGRRFLPLPLNRDRKPIIKNPVVHRALFEMRKVANAIIREYGKPKRIVVEIIRDMKLPLSRRIENVDRQNANQQERERAKAVLCNDFGLVNANGIDILTYRLWNQQNRVSPYSGRVISQSHIHDFLHGRGVLQIDHILPYSMTLDDSQNNKCLCFVDENLEKGQRTPREWKGENTPEYDAMLACVAHMKDSGMPWAKRRRFSQKEVKSDEFVARQLVDTAYLAREVRSYLKCLYSGTEDSRNQRVQTRPGHVTAALRHQWHLNMILSPDGSNEKNRADHRHHTIDAIVIALTTPSHLHHLSQTDRSLRERRAAMPPPDNWATFVEDVRTAMDSINVSHRVQRKIAGKLHHDTALGRTAKKVPQSAPRPWAKGWIEQSNVYVRRKPLDELDNTTQLFKIRDETIRAIVIAHVQNAGIDIDGSNKIPKSVWHDLPTMPGSCVLIRKVRLLERGDAYKEIRPGVFSELQNNHHYTISDAALDSNSPGRGTSRRPRRESTLITTLDVARKVADARRELRDAIKRIKGRTDSPSEIRRLIRAVRSEVSRRFCLIPRSLRPEGGTITVSINEMYMLQLNGTTKVLHRVQKMSEGSIILRPHSYAGEVSDRDKPPLIQRRTPNTLQGQKVVVDPLGRIRFAND